MRKTLNSTGSLNDDKTLLYNVTISHDNGNQYTYRSDAAQGLISASLYYSLDPNTYLRFNFNYDLQQTQPNQAVSAIGTITPAKYVLADNFNGESQSSKRSDYLYSATFIVGHKFNDWLSIESDNRIDTYSFFQNLITAGFPTAASPLAAQTASANGGPTQVYTTDNKLKANGTIFGQSNEALLGVEYSPVAG